MRVFVLFASTGAKSQVPVSGFHASSSELNVDGQISEI